MVVSRQLKQVGVLEAMLTLFQKGASWTWGRARYSATSLEGNQ